MVRGMVWNLMIPVHRAAGKTSGGGRKRRSVAPGLSSGGTQDQRIQRDGRPVRRRTALAVSVTLSADQGPGLRGTLSW